MGGSRVIDGTYATFMPSKRDTSLSRRKAVVLSIPPARI
jgi:hypothetical protein